MKTCLMFSGAHVVLHPPLIKIFWCFTIQTLLGRLLCCLIPQFFPDSSDATAPVHSLNLYFTDDTAHNKNDLLVGRVHFWFRKRGSKANKLGGIHQRGGLRVERWRKSEASLWQVKQGYYNIPHWWMHTLHFENYFKIQEQMLDKKMQTLASMLIHLADLYYVTRSIGFPIGTCGCFH